MPRPYLNREETDNLLKVGCCSGELDNLATMYRKFGFTVEAKKLKTAGTMSGNAVVSRLEMLDPQQLIAFNRRLNHSKVTVESTDNRRMKSPSDEAITLSIDDYRDVVESALIGACRGCSGKPDCSLRNIFLRTDIPAVDEYEGCPYRWSDE